MGIRHIGKHYLGEVQFQTDNYLVRYYDITLAYSKYLKDAIDELVEGPESDVIILSSCLGT